VDSLAVGDSSTQTLTITNSGTSYLTFDISVDESTPAHSASLTVDESIASLASRGKSASGHEAEPPPAPLVTRTGDASEGLTAVATVARSLSPELAGLDVALLAADNESSAQDVQSLLLSTGRFASVSVINARAVTPTLAELSAFDALLVWNNNPFANATASGDVLAAYVDGGGGVVCAMFLVAGYQPLAGNWASGPYLLFEPGGYISGGPLGLGVVALPTHPIMTGVGSFNGGPGSYRPASPVLTEGTTLVASWSDGRPLAAVRKVGTARRVDLGFFPPSSNAFSGGWQVDTDGDLLLANALEWVATSWLEIAPKSGTVPAGGSLDLTVTFDASRLFGGDYLADLRVASNDTVTPEVIVGASLHVTGVPDVSLSDSLLDYGITFTGTVATDSLLVTNEGTDLLIVNIQSSDPVHFGVGPTAFSLGPFESHSVAIAFSPDAPEEFSGSLSLSSNDPDEPDLTVSLTGLGLDPPVISVTPDSVVDSLFTGETSTHGLTVYNTGQSDLAFRVTSERVDPPAGLTVEEAVASLARRGGSQPGVERAPRASVLQAPLQDIESSPRGAAARIARPSTLRPPALNVALLAADDPTFVSDVDDLLLSSGRFASVSVIDVVNATPELAELQAFDAVLVWSNYSFELPVVLGDRLADYVDAGGGVVCAMLEMYGDAYISLGGRWESDRYYLIERSGYRCCDDLSLGVVADPSHPIMDNVTSFEGGYGSYRPGTEGLTNGSTLVASWSDGTPLVVTRNMPTSRRVDLGFFPPSSRVGGSDFWNADTEGDLLLANALEWASRSWIDVEPDSGVVPAGGQLNLTLQFDAARLLGGDYRADVRIASNDPLTPEVEVPARLHVTGVPDIVVSPTMLDYGNTFTGATATDTLVIRNVGTDVLTLDAISVDETDFMATTVGFSLTPGALHKLAVSFAPSATGVFNGTLSISSDDPDEPTVSVSLTGIGLDPPVISVSPDSLSDSLRVGEMSTHTLTIVNGGFSELAFDIQFGEPVVPRTTVAAQDAGIDVALLAADNPQFVADVQSYLLGTGAIGSVSWIDVASGVPRLAELQAFDAVLVWNGNSYADRDGLGDTLAAYVDAGGGVVCALFESAGTLGMGGRWDAERYYVFGRTGVNCCINATLGMVYAPSHPIMAGVSSLDGGYLSSRPSSDSLVAGSFLVASWSDGLPLVATREIGSARRVDLGFFPPSSDVYPDSWRAETDGGRLIANALSWVALPWLSAQPPSGTVPAGGTLDVSLTFDATRVNGGHYSANIRVHSNDPITPTVNVAASLQVTGIADVAVPDTQLAFGARFLGTETTDTLVVFNEGTDQLAVTVELSGPSDFDMNTESFTVGPGERRTLAVTFAPATTGEKSGAIAVYCNDPDEPTLHVALSGSGIEPPVLSLPSDELDDSLFVGETHTRLLTLSNTGLSDLVFDITVESGSPPLLSAADASSPPPSLNVALLAATYADYYVTDVQQMLQATGKFNSVSTINVRLMTPTLSSLLAFDAVLVWTDSYYANATAFGNALADYVDAGGGVVCALYESTGYQYGRLGGRWETGAYAVFSRGPSRSGSYASLGEVLDPRHPLMFGVRTFLGGEGSLRPGSAGLSLGSTLIAAWSDGMPLVATKQMAVARRVDLGLYPPSNDVHYDSWEASTDGDQLMANALVWVSRSWVDVEPGSGVVAPGAQLDLTVTLDAARLAAGDYAALLVFRSNDPVLPRLELEAHLYAMPAMPGDCNGDGYVSAMDILHLVNYVFKNAAPPRGQTGDFSCDFAVTVVDVIALVNHVFKGGTIENCP